MKFLRNDNHVTYCGADPVDMNDRDSELSASMEIIRKTVNEIWAEIKEPTAGEEAVGSQKDGD